MNKNFEEPKHEIIHLNNTDVIAASGAAEPTTPGGGSGSSNPFGK